MASTSRKSSEKANPYNVQLNASETPGDTHIRVLRQETANKVSELLMLNHAKYHTLFNEVGLHNHIVHHLLSIWALGASPEEAQTAYDLNKHYQLPHYHNETTTALKLQNSASFKEYLGKSEYYTDYLHFFQDDISRRGVEAVVNEYVFAGDERANDILGRMYSGFLHPILHLGFALEFHQPCLVAEALAAASIHDDWPIPIIMPIEKHISSTPDLPYTSFLSIVEALRNDPVVKEAVRPDDPPNRVTDALMRRATPEMIKHLANWRVKATKEDIDYRCAEMVHACAYIAGAAQHPKKQPAIDFFLMHNVNLSIFYPTFMKLEWISVEAKARLLTWKGWMDMVIYAACGSPELYPDRITSYKPKNPSDWNGIAARATKYKDDGHTAKLIRALLNAEKTSLPYLGNPDFPLKKEDFLQIAHMTMDSVERMNDPDWKLPEQTRKIYVEMLGEDEEVARIVARWTRWCGTKGAWEDFPDLQEGARAKL